MNARGKEMFAVSVEGLRRLARRRGIARIVLELVQNSLDAASDEIRVSVETALGGRIALTVEDNAPHGWVNLEDAYTLFNPSAKGPDPVLRGRFNLGEKFFVSLTERCEISTISGGIVFENGRRAVKRKTGRASGTLIVAVLRATKEVAAEITSQLWQVIVPAGVSLVVNTKPVPVARVLASVSVSLQTEITDAEGVLRPRTRATRVDLLEPADGGPAWLYEMGIPICPSGGDRFHYNVHQRIPLGMDREAPSEGYWRSVRAAGLEAAAGAGLLTSAVTGDAWVREALDYRQISAGTAKAFATAAFGGKAVSYDPSDPEANHLAVASGFQVVHGGSLSKQAWEHLRAAEAILPAGRVTPSPKPFSPDGKPLRLREPSPEEERTLGHMQGVAEVLIGRKIAIRLADDPGWGFRGAYGQGELTINTAKFADDWWNLKNPDRREQLEDFILHELGHEFEGNHLSDRYYRALTRLGAKLARAIRDGTIQ